MATDQTKPVPDASGKSDAPGQAGSAATPPHSLEDIMRHLGTLAESHKALNKRLDGIVQMEHRRDQEIAAARRTRGTDQFAPDVNIDDSDPYRLLIESQLRERDVRLRQMEDRNDLAQFKIDNPDWKEYWEEIQEVVRDPTLAPVVVSTRSGQFDENGQPAMDYYRTLSAAKLAAENKRLRKAKVEADEAKAQLAADKAKLESQAAISGDSTASEDTGERVDLSNVTSDQMLMKGLIPVDPRDPGRFLIPAKE